MLYVGGKDRLAKHLMPYLPLTPRVGSQSLFAEKELSVWEPFMGGCNMSVHLARCTQKMLCSDIHPSLAPLYQAVQDGWDPPKTLSEEEYQAAKSLPDSNPIKAFAGFGCSFSGKWFGGYARSPVTGRNYADQLRNTLLRRRKFLLHVRFETLDFLTADPGTFDLIYCDPPYAATTGYSTRSFDHTAFWDRCIMWANRGSLVYVSEYECPINHELLFERARDRGLRKKDRSLPVERLFRVLPQGREETLSAAELRAQHQIEAIAT